MKILSKKNTENFSETESLTTNNNYSNENKSSTKYFWTVVILIILLGVILSYLSWSSKIAHPSRKDWQAIFLVNGQVYFGKVVYVSSKTLVLTDIYYLQFITKPLQTSEKGEVSKDQQTQQELTLIKLGNELHGPTDKMIINRDQILLTEKLSKDSKVIEAINRYINDKNKK